MWIACCDPIRTGWPPPGFYRPGTEPVNWARVRPPAAPGSARWCAERQEAAARRRPERDDTSEADTSPKVNPRFMLTKSEQNILQTNSNVPDKGLLHLLSQDSTASEQPHEPPPAAHYLPVHATNTTNASTTPTPLSDQRILNKNAPAFVPPKNRRLTPVKAKLSPAEMIRAEMLRKVRVATQEARSSTSKPTQSRDQTTRDEMLRKVRDATQKQTTQTSPAKHPTDKTVTTLEAGDNTTEKELNPIRAEMLRKFAAAKNG